MGSVTRLLFRVSVGYIDRFIALVGNGGGRHKNKLRLNWLGWMDVLTQPAATWLVADGLLAQFAKRRSLAQQRYAQFVAEGIKAASPWQGIKG